MEMVSVRRVVCPELSFAESTVVYVPMSCVVPVPSRYSVREDVSGQTVVAEQFISDADGARNFRLGAGCELNSQYAMSSPGGSVNVTRLNTPTENARSLSYEITNTPGAERTESVNVYCVCPTPAVTMYGPVWEYVCDSVTVSPTFW